jgi:hypothetical protein
MGRSRTLSREGVEKLSIKKSMVKGGGMKKVVM